MVREIPITQQRLALNGAVQETGGPMGGAKMLKQLSGMLLQQRDAYVANARETAYIKGQTELTENLSRIQREHPNDPDALSSAMNEYRAGFMEKVQDPEMQARFDLQIERTAQTAINRATANRKSLMDEQSRFHNLRAMESIRAEIREATQDINSQDPAIALASQQRLQEAMMRGNGLANAAGADGVPLFSASFRANELANITDAALEGAFESWYNQQPNKVKALEAFENGQVEFELPNFQGGKDVINIANTISPQSKKLLVSAAKAEIAEKKALATQQRNVLASNIELAIKTARDQPIAEGVTTDNQKPGKSRGQILSSILKQIDENPLFRETPEGIIKGNDLREKVFTKLEEDLDDADNISLGSAFASGNAYFNHQNNDHKKAYNKYYEALVPQLSSMEPAQRNVTIANMISNAKAVPDTLKGDIQRISRSVNPEEITQAANLIEQVAQTNPHLLPDLAPTKDMARLNMINDRINSGYTPEKAIEVTDKILDPNNRITTEQARDELKALDIDYRVKAVGTFEPGIFAEIFSLGFAGPDTPETFKAKAALDSATAYYRKAYEDHYQITRDENLSEKHAQNFVRGLFGQTEINGTTQVMAYAPEKYYSLQDGYQNSPGYDSKWMRRQMLDEVKKRLSNSLLPEGFKASDSVILVSDPHVTRSTAAQGRPEYKLMLINDDGSFQDLLEPDEYFYFEPEKEMQRIDRQTRKLKESLEFQDEYLNDIVTKTRFE